MGLPDRIIITGISGGLGKGLADALPRDRVLGISRTTGVLRLDLSDYTSTYREVHERAKGLGGDRIAIILAAATLGSPGGIARGFPGEWGKTFETNVLGNLAVLSALLPHMVETDYGRVVFLAGGGAASAYPLFSGYALSKAAVVREVENIHQELQTYIEDFSIIALAPGAMPTNMLKEVEHYGGEVKTRTEISEPVNFIKKFISMDKEEASRLSGRFVHVRDELGTGDLGNKWLLRRTE